MHIAVLLTFAVAGLPAIVAFLIQIIKNEQDPAYPTIIVRIIQGIIIMWYVMSATALLKKKWTHEEFAK